MSMKFVNVALVLFAEVLTTDAVSCYLCDSGSNKNCGDPFSAAGVSSITGCKACTKATSLGVVTRMCTMWTSSEACNEDKGRESCTCIRDLCNAAPQVTVTMGTILTGSTAVLLMELLFMF
ncbi:hypothetical protein DPMN_124345 [Dreissena polymorpha]|uniref:Uncharacterized protein n=1 Tax=Dreissena polymorpha TaxID=45954 RepID=A0A9D4JSF2_DREPO|nr:hypothetical protein DPMN_124345 [Dreissena polymorpha]